MNKTNSRNLCLDSFKGIACLFVIFLHTGIPYETTNNTIFCIARFAVPLFFMVSGYYAYYKDPHVMKQKLKKKINHILKIAVISLLFWLFVKLSICLFGMSNHSIKQLFLDITNLKSLFKFIVFNADPLINILWFIFALLYIYIIMYVFLKINRIKLLILLSPVLLSLHFIMGNIARGLGHTFPLEIYRNCYFMGIPLFLIGYLIRKHNIWISSKMSLTLIFAGFFLAIIEQSLVGKTCELYIGSILTASSMILYSIENPSKFSCEILCDMGNKYSLFIYVVHISVGIFIDKIMKILGLIDNNLYLSIKPFFVMFCSVISAMVFYKIIDVFNKQERA